VVEIAFSVFGQFLVFKKFVKDKSLWRNVILIGFFKIYIVWILEAKFDMIYRVELFTGDFGFVILCNVMG